MRVLRKILGKIKNTGAKQKALQTAKKKRLVLIVFLLFVLYLVLSNTVFDEKRIGTRRHRKEASFCQADDECMLYNCTNCGNKFWVNKNDDTHCDKKSSIIIGCSCVEGKCKRVIKTK